MKREELLRHLRSQGCEFLREGGRHSWWHNPSQNRRAMGVVQDYYAEFAA
jgi:mRNA interferase HicA